MDGWIKKVWHISNGILLSKKKKKRERERNPAICATWFDLEGIMLSKMSDKDKCHMISLTYGIYKKIT